MAGEILKQRREELGLTIETIADSLKIRADYLSAIENELFDKLPPPVYTVGYLRSYAKHLDIAPDSLVSYYVEHLSQPTPATIIPVGFSQKKSPKAAYVLAGAVIVAGLFAGFHYFRPGGDRKIVASLNGADMLRPVVPAPNAPAVRASEEIQHDLEVTANDTTWVSIQFNGGRTEEALLQPGTSKNWKFSEKASLKIGNAGGVSLRFDGEDVGTPGNPGQVKTLSFPSP